MEKELKDLLHQVLANQIVIYKKLEDVKRQQGGSFRMASLKSYAGDLKKEAEQVLNFFKDDSETHP